MESDVLQVVHEILRLIIIILPTGMIAGIIAKRMRVPDVAVYLLAGIIVGPFLHVIHLPAGSSINQLLLVIGAALILFDGGRGIRFLVLKEVWPTIVFLSIPGVLITAAITGEAASWLLHLPMMYAWLLAALIASTDPATLIPVFRQVSIQERVRQTVESESAFNDATGSILTFTILGIVLGTHRFSLAESAISFASMALGGIGVGFVAGWLAALLVSDKKYGFFRDYTSLCYVIVAIASYFIGDSFGFSGFMATFTAGVFLGNHTAFHIPISEQQIHHVNHFFYEITLMVRIIIFVVLGTQVDIQTLVKYWIPGLAVIAVFMLLARPVTVLACALPDRIAKWKWNEILFMFWVRETGVIPAALVGMIAGTGIAHMDVIASVTFLAILITIVLQASTTPWVAKKLRLIVKKKD